MPAVHTRIPTRVYFGGGHGFDEKGVYILDTNSGGIEFFDFGLDFIGWSDLLTHKNQLAIVGRRDSDDEMKLYVFDTNSGNVKEIPTPGCRPQSPKWSPDGKWILFHCYGEDESGYSVLKVESGESISIGEGQAFIAGSGYNDAAIGYDSVEHFVISPEGFTNSRNALLWRARTRRTVCI